MKGSICAVDVFLDQATSLLLLSCAPRTGFALDQTADDLPGVRHACRMFWKHKSRARTRKPKLSSKTIALIKEIAAHNRLWGAERIRGERLKLEIQVSKRTIQRYIKQIRPRRAHEQTWKTFLRNHVKDVWACDFL